MEVVCLKNIKKYIWVCTIFTFLLTCTIVALDKTDSPQGIRVVFLSNKKIYLEWEKEKDVDYYNIYKCNKKDGSYEIIYKSYNNLYTIENVVPGSKVFYKITSVKDNAESKFSVVIPVEIPKIDPPKSIYISAVSSSAIYLRWDKIYEADYYLIYRSNSAKGQYIKIGKTDVNTYIDTGLRPLTPYFYKIKLVKNEIESSFSEVVYSTTN
jgi:fibronectin type 3 domain-containing protein